MRSRSLLAFLLTLPLVAPAAAQTPTEAMRPLADRLTSEDTDHRRAAREELCQRFGRDAVPVFRKALRGTSRHARYEALADLREDAAAAVPEVRALLADPDGEIRRRALLLLGTLGPQARDAEDDLLKLAGSDPDADVRLAAASVFARLRSERSAEMTAILARELGRSSGEQAHRVASPLCEFGTAGQRVVSSAVFCRDEATARVCIQALSRVGQPDDDLVNAFRRLLRDGPTGLRAEVLQALTGHPAIAAEVVADAFALTDDPDQDVREAAFLALRAAGPAAAAEMGCLALRGRKETRPQALQALANLDSDAAPAVPSLLELLGDPDAKTRSTTAGILMCSGDAAWPALPRLAVLARSDLDSGVRNQARAAIFAIEGPSFSRWRGWLRGPDPAGWEWAEAAVGELPPAVRSRAAAELYDLARWKPCPERVASLSRVGAAAVPYLREFCLHPDPAVAAEALRRLRFCGPAAASALPELKRLLADEEDLIRKEALERLASLGPAARPAVPLLRRQAQEGDPEAPDTSALARHPWACRALVGPMQRQLSHPYHPSRRTAADVLRLAGPDAKSAVPELLNALRDPVPSVRAGACRVLATVSPATGAAAPALRRALADESRNLRWAAASALVQIGEAGSADLHRVAAELVDADREPTEANDWDTIGFIGIPVAASSEARAVIRAGLPACVIAGLRRDLQRADRRGFAAWCLGIPGPVAREAVPDLRGAPAGRAGPVTPPAGPLPAGPASATLDASRPPHRPECPR